MENSLKAAEVQEKHAAVLAAVEAVDVAFKGLMLLTPEGEKQKDQKTAPRMFNPDMIDSAQHIARALKEIRLDSLVVAQSVMMFTEEAREAALQAKEGEMAAQATEQSGMTVLPGGKDA